MMQHERKIVVYRTENEDSDNANVEYFDCEPDEFDVQEGVTPVDMALEVLNLKIYAEEASSYPDWQRSTWYSRTERDSYTDHLTEISAHLVNFSDVEAAEVYKRFTER